jgi:uncharacterized protein (DUF1684 family)
MSAMPDPAAPAVAGRADASSSALARAADSLALADWRRRVFELYRDVREAQDPAAAWRRWRAGRDELFAHHPQSPLPAGERSGFSGLGYFGYDPSARVLATVAPLEPTSLEIATSGEEPYRFTRFGTVGFELGGEPLALELYWLEGYGGGLYLPFADSTSGAETYGAGRYLLDTIKGADLGIERERLVLDFNFAYNPSCAYDPSWICPLAPPANRLAVAIRAGERTD